MAIDVTSLLDDALTGVGRFAAAVTSRLARSDDVDVVAFAASWRHRDRLSSRLAGEPLTLVTRPMAARPLRRAWSSVAWPPIEWWTGSVDVVHGLNYVVPPTRRARQVVTIHDLTCVRFPELCTPDTLAFPTLIRRALARGAWIHTVSETIAEEVIDAFDVPAERVVVITNGFTPTTVTTRLRRHVQAPAPFVLALGTIEPRKNLPHLVEAFDHLASTYPTLRLVVAGPPGWGIDAFEAAVARAAHRDRIDVLGYIDEARRAQLLADATVFAFPSLYEGFGIPPLEAMAAGTPVVASNRGGLAETVGDAALIVDPDDPDDIAEKIADVLDHTHTAERLVAAGHRNLARFSWDATAEQLAALYQRVRTA